MATDMKRIAAMIAECDDDGELTEVLAEVYGMLPPGRQAAFRAAIGPGPDPAAWDEDRRRKEARELAEAHAADFRRRADAAADRTRQALEAISGSPERSPEELAELQARLERLQRGQDPGGPPEPDAPAAGGRRRKPVVQQPSRRLASMRSMTPEETRGTRP